MGNGSASLAGRGGGLSSGGSSRRLARGGSGSGENGDRGRDRSALALVRVTTDDILRLEVVPRRAVKVLRGGVDNDTTADSVELGQGSIVKGTDKVNGTTNRLKNGEAAERGKLGIVGNLETTANLGELGEGDIGQLRVGDNGKRALNVGQLGELDVRNGGVDVGEGGVDFGNVANVDGASVAESDIVGRGESGEVDRDRVGSGGNINLVGRGEGKVQGSEVLVVVNVKDLDSGGVQAAEGGERRIRDDKRVNGGDAGGKVDAANLVHGDEIERADAGERGKVNLREGLENAQVNSVRDRVEQRGRERGEGSQVSDGKGALDALDTVNGGASDGSGQDNVALEGGAGRNLVEVRLGGCRESGRADRAGRGRGSRGRGGGGGG